MLSTTPAFAANPTSSSFAGYLASQAQVSSTNANFPVPRITCDVGSNLAMGVGALMFGNSPNPTATGAIIRTECVNGTPSYSVGVILNGTKTAPTLRVHPGNLIEIDLAESASATTISVANHTSGRAVAQSTGSGVAMTLGEIGILGISGTAGPPAFKAVTFSGSLVNGMALDALSPAPGAWDWANSGVTVIHTSRITSDVFKTKFI